MAGGRGRARMVGTRRRDPVRHGGTAAVHATVGPQLAAWRQDHQADADKRNHRDAWKGELQQLLSHQNVLLLLLLINISHYINERRNKYTSL